MCSTNARPQYLSDRRNEKVIPLPTPNAPIDQHALNDDLLTTHLQRFASDIRIAGNSSIDSFLTEDQTARVFHEMQSPLSVILNVLNSYKQTQLKEPDRTRLILALEEANRLKRLTDEILAHARYPQKPAFHWADIQFRELVSEVFQVMAELPVAGDRRIILSSKPPDVLVRGDRDKLKQVFLNLLVNACEAIDAEQTIVVQCQLNLDLHQVMVQIHNGGQPILAELLPVLGYQQVTTKFSGNGLGLLIVKKIIDAHSGKFQIQSSELAGTTALVSIPIAQRQPA